MVADSSKLVDELYKKCKSGDKSAFAELLQLANVEPPDAYAMLYISKCYHYGYGCDKDNNEAFGWSCHGAG